MSDVPELPPELAAHIRTEVKQALNEWVKESLFTQENMELLWTSAFHVLQDNAAEHTGKFIFSSIGTVLRKLSVFILLGAFVYAAGGWSALVTFVRSLIPHGST